MSADGHRCEETGRLEIDHITPVALGGTTTPENLRVLCRAHNQFEAERVLGKEHVQRRREIARLERVKVRPAAKATGNARRTDANNGDATSGGGGGGGGGGVLAELLCWSTNSASAESSPSSASYK